MRPGLMIYLEDQNEARQNPIYPPDGTLSLPHRRNSMQLTDFKVLTFDCYGTLIDWETGIHEALEPLAARAGRKLTRDQMLEAHARHEAAQEAATPSLRYSDLLALVHGSIARDWGVEASAEESRAYGRSIGNWPA